MYKNQENYNNVQNLSLTFLWQVEFILCTNTFQICIIISKWFELYRKIPSIKLSYYRLILIGKLLRLLIIFL